jgi:cytochrome o ubiquinol oxidase subunit III
MSQHWTGPIHHEETLRLPADTRTPDPHQDTYAKNVFGFWLYLMTDCLLFASLFATYAILHQNTFGGPSSKEIFSLPLAFAETMILLFSSLTCGLAILASLKNKKKQVITWLAISFLLGATFVGLELHEFTQLLEEGHSWKVSAFLSAYFGLVGTHGLHVTIGLLWLIVIIAQLAWQGINVDTFRRLSIFSLFWHFLDVVWIFIFTFVYLMGVI